MDPMGYTTIAQPFPHMKGGNPITLSTCAAKINRSVMFFGGGGWVASPILEP